MQKPSERIGEITRALKNKPLISCTAQSCKCEINWETVEGILLYLDEIYEEKKSNSGIRAVECVKIPCPNPSWGCKVSVCCKSTARGSNGYEVCSKCLKTFTAAPCTTKFIEVVNKKETNLENMKNFISKSAIHPDDEVALLQAAAEADKKIEKEVLKCPESCVCDHCDCTDPIMNPPIENTVEEKKLWEVVREFLAWYRELKEPDHGDLVIAEEAILLAHEKVVSTAEKETRRKIREAIEEKCRRETGHGKDSFCDVIYIPELQD